MSRKFPQSLSASLLAGLIVGLFASGSASGATPWPGQSGNPVGYASYGPLGTTQWPGGSFQSGTATNPTIYSGYVFTGQQSISGSYIEFIGCDFNSGTGGVVVSGSNITFVGDRFQSNDTQNYNVQTTGSNITFFYSSFTPLASFYTSPPGSAWPSAGAGQNTTTQTTNTNAINGNDGYQYGVNISSGGPVTIDHSDFWGFGNAIVFYSTTAQMNITNNWIHDAANASSQGYHTDGPGYLNGGAGPSNVTVLGNTIASLGNTNGIAFQAATSGYNNMHIDSNYLSGFGYTTDPGAPGTTHFSNSTVMGNTFGTDVEPVWGPLYANAFSAGSNALWACNKLAFRSGTTWTDGDGWTPTSSIDGKYWIPTSPSGVASSTDYNGNTVCPSFGTSSLAWQSQQLNITSSGQTVVLTNTGTGSLTSLSVALQIGTQFAISSNTCGSTLVSGANCTVTVTFTPTSLGPQADNLQFTDNAAAPSSPQSVPLIGIGTSVAAPTGLLATVQ
jgi:Abnormal spindle-like microcephaly-assoc'd, ASPM-SPD-2-Hydin